MASVSVLDIYDRISDIIPKDFRMMTILESIVHPLARCLIHRILPDRLTPQRH